MASQEDIEAFYDGLGYFHVLRMGKYKDYTCAFFNGDFDLTRSSAGSQTRLGVERDWFSSRSPHTRHWLWLGPMLQAVNTAAEPPSASHSRYQERTVQRSMASMRGCSTTNKQIPALGQFDGIVCVGAFEHFCSPEEYLAGRQAQLYKDFFRFCSALLRPHGRLYLQSGLFGKRVMDPASLRADAPKDSEERVCFRLSKIYPRAWLPADKAQVIACASDDFSLASNNGRKDLHRNAESLGRLHQEPVPPAQSLAGVLQGDFHDSALSRGVRFSAAGFMRRSQRSARMFETRNHEPREDVLRKEIV